MRILIFTTDIPPVPGFPTSGTALRTWGLGQGFSAHGHEVVFAPPLQAFEKLSPEHLAHPVIAELKRHAFHAQNQSQVVHDIQPDAVVYGHWPACIAPHRPSVPVILDLPGPYLLERHYQGMTDNRAAVAGKLHAMTKADLFIVSGPSQQAYFESFMARAGVTSARERIVEIPMPLPPAVETPFDDAGYPVFIFAGMFLPWQDPSWALSALGRFLKEQQRGKLLLVGGSHPHYPVTSPLYEDLFRLLEKEPRVERHALMPFDDLVVMMRGAHVALDLMAWNLERELAVTIRTTSYLWAGLPVIYNDYSDLSEDIRTYGAGWLVSPGDEKAFKEVVEEIVASPETVRRKRAGAFALAANRFDWAKSVQPLVAILERSERRFSVETDIDTLGFPATHAPLAAPCSQPFLCRMNGLYSIRVRPHRGSPMPSITLSRLALPPGPQNQAAFTTTSVVTDIVPLTAVPDREHLDLTFPQQDDSAGSWYVLTSSAPLETVRSAGYPLGPIFNPSTSLEHVAYAVKTVCKVPLL